MGMSSKEYKAFVAAVKAWIDPEGPHQKRLLRELVNGNPVALKINMAEPAFDGDFEIIFVKAAEAKKDAKKFGVRGDTVEILSFAEGLKLAKLPNCSGGPYILSEAKKMLALKPDLLETPNPFTDPSPA